MKESEQIDFLEKNINHQIGMIRAADSRSAFAFALNTSMLGVLAAVFPKDPNEWQLYPLIMVGITTLLILLSLFSLTLAAFPRVKGPKGSLIYFKGISERSREEFKNELSNLSTENYLSDLTDQAHRNAEIASRKFYWVQRVFLFLYLAVPPWAVVIYHLFSPN